VEFLRLTNRFPQVTHSLSFAQLLQNLSFQPLGICLVSTNAPQMGNKVGKVSRLPGENYVSGGPQMRVTAIFGRALVDESCSQNMVRVFPRVARLKDGAKTG
jgi:hypothetical protein